MTVLLSTMAFAMAIPAEVPKLFSERSCKKITDLGQIYVCAITFLSKFVGHVMVCKMVCYTHRSSCNFYKFVNKKEVTVSLGHQHSEAGLQVPFLSSLILQKYP